MGSNNLLDKLMRVERTINVYRNEDEELLQEINVDSIPFEKLKEIVSPVNEDSLMYDGYDLNKEQLNMINSYLADEINPDFNLYSYILVCGGIYDWDRGNNPIE
jgi:hypothetical protein